jgi:hypothetical protein
MTDILEMQATIRGLRELSSGSPHGLALGSYARREIAPVVRELLARARDAGVLRCDVTEQDLALVPVMIGAVSSRTRGADPELWRRSLAIVLDGLRSIHDDPLPGSPPDSAQLAGIIGHE